MILIYLNDYFSERYLKSNTNLFMVLVNSNSLACLVFYCKKSDDFMHRHLQLYTSLTLNCKCLDGQSPNKMLPVTHLLTGCPDP